MAGEFAPFGGYGPDVPIDDGYVTLPDAPGFGFETKPDLAAVFEKLIL